MRYADDFLQYFAQNWTEDIFIHFRDGLFYLGADIGDNKYVNLSTGEIRNNQPNNSVWMAVKFLRQPTRAATIGVPSDILKDEGFIFNVRIFTPVGKSNKTAYELESKLDQLFQFESIPATDAVIYTEKDPIKLTDEPVKTSQSVWSELRLSYRFFARYF